MAKRKSRSRWYRGCDQQPKIKPRKRPKNSEAPAFYRTARWHGLRGYVLQRDQRLCRYCRAEAIQADHVIPRHAGGNDEVDNLVACCRACNKQAGGRTFASFEEKKAWILNTRNPATFVVFPPRSRRR